MVRYHCRDRIRPSQIGMFPPNPVVSCCRVLGRLLLDRRICQPIKTRCYGTRTRMYRGAWYLAPVVVYSPKAYLRVSTTAMSLIPLMVASANPMSGRVS